jgi:hypothetical protein
VIPGCFPDRFFVTLGIKNGKMPFDIEIDKLTTVNNPAIIHGLISLSDKTDHIFMDLIERAKFNKGKKSNIMVSRATW